MHRSANIVVLLHTFSTGKEIEGPQKFPQHFHSFILDTKFFRSEVGPSSKS